MTQVLQGKSGEAVARPDTERTVYVPEVDVCEGRDAVRLRVNMPGVEKDTVDVRCENNVLTIEGTAAVAAPPGYRPVGQEFDSARFRRAFDLSDRIAVEGIKAQVRDGVLTVTLPKLDRVQTRKIDIQSD